MLSILIPIYNRNVTKLVDGIQKQCQKAKIDYEIICFDDLSEEKYKKENIVLSNYFKVNYTELSKNLGRAKIRNWLAKSASYETILFLDCDSKVVDRKFISNYLPYVNKSAIVSGGRVYSKKPPRAYTKYLHWLYGTHKESKVAKFRNKQPIKYFHSNNFMAPRQIILDHPFDEALSTYGYEDLLYAQLLSDSGVDILHIDNPIEHLGLEKNKVFLEKSKTAIDNLLYLKYQNKPIPTNIEKVANQIYDFGLYDDFIHYYNKRKERIEDNLMSKTPTLRSLDSYKLYYYYTRRMDWVEGRV